MVHKNNSPDAVSTLGVATGGSAVTLVFHSISRKYGMSAAPFFLQVNSTWETPRGRQEGTRSLIKTRVPDRYHPRAFTLVHIIPLFLVYTC